MIAALNNLHILSMKILPLCLIVVMRVLSHIHNHDTINRNLLCPERVYYEFVKHNIRHEIINILNIFPVDSTMLPLKFIHTVYLDMLHQRILTH